MNTWSESLSLVCRKEYISGGIILRYQTVKSWYRFKNGWKIY